MGIIDSKAVLSQLRAIPGANQNTIVTTNMYNRNHRVTEVLNSTTLLGKKCFIIGGGESIKNLDFEPLKNHFTIGINRTFQFFPTSILYCMDYELYNKIIQKKLDEELGEPIYDKFLAYTNPKIFPAVVADWKIGHDCYVVNRIYEKCINKENLDLGIFIGSNSGFGAIMLAIAMGCKDINLIGFDMKVGNKIHFHSGYPKQTKENYSHGVEIFRNEMFEWATTFVYEGISITACYLESPEETTLNCFTKRKLFDIISV